MNLKHTAECVALFLLLFLTCYNLEEEKNNFLSSFPTKLPYKASFFFIPDFFSWRLILGEVSPLYFVKNKQVCIRWRI